MLVLFGSDNFYDKRVETASPIWRRYLFVLSVIYTTLIVIKFSSGPYWLNFGITRISSKVGYWTMVNITSKKIDQELHE